MMCSNSSTKNSTIMKHLHREKCSHFHLCFVYLWACVCIFLFICPVHAMWWYEKKDRTEKKTNSRYEKWMWCGHKSTWSTSGVLCVILVSEFLLMLYHLYVCMRVCESIRVFIIRSFFYAFHLHSVFFFHFSAVVFDKKRVYFVCLSVIDVVVVVFSFVLLDSLVILSFREFHCFSIAARYTHSLALFVTVSTLHSCCDCNLTIAILVRLFPLSIYLSLARLLPGFIPFFVSIPLTNLNYGIWWHIKQYIKIGYCEKLKITRRKNDKTILCSLMCVYTNDKMNENHHFQLVSWIFSHLTTKHFIYVACGLQKQSWISISLFKIK